MPYIESKTTRRKELREGAAAILAGELNYQIFHYLKHNYSKNHLYEINGQIYSNYGQVLKYVKAFLEGKKSYQKYNDMRGCLVSCYKECQRRLGINPTFLCDIMESYDEEINIYEDLKIQENGDVE
jgi:hypothetical protein